MEGRNHQCGPPSTVEMQCQQSEDTTMLGAQHVKTDGSLPHNDLATQAGLVSVPASGPGTASAGLQRSDGASATARETPALDFNGYILHASPRGVPEELQRDSTGASIAEPDAILDEENGRTYHNYHDGRYFLPNDPAEQDRLDLQHKLWTVHLDNALYRAPINSPKNVLDVATGTGIWAIQFAKQHPESSVVGTDLSLIQPKNAPENCSFVKEDAELDQWTLPVRFDYIHLRMVHTCFDDYQAVIRRCFDNLEPGGWVELQDAVFKLLCTDGSADNSYIERFSQLILQGGRSIGRDFEIPSRYKEMLTEAGFVDVEEEVGPIPGNPWPSERKFKELGMWQMTNSHKALRGFGWKLFRKLGMPPDEIEELVRLAKNDITDTKLHFFFPIYVVYGRKPEAGELAQRPNKRAKS